VSDGWKLTRLGDVLRSVSRPVRLSPESTYRLIGAHWYAKGLYVKEERTGTEIQAKTLFQIKEGDFVYNRLFAWKGSFAVAGPDVDGCFVSNEFPCFVPLDAVDSKFLWFYFSRSSTWDKALGLSSGSTPTSRNRLKEDQFLDMEVRLPPIGEQRRIVSRIEELSAKIKEAHRLRRETLEETKSIMAAEELKVWPKNYFENARTLDEVTTFLARGRHSGQGPSGHYLVKTQHVQLGRYVETEITLAANEAARVKPEAIVKSGDVLIACSAAGCLGRVAFYQGPKKQISTDTHVAIARANREVIDAEYLYHYLKGAQGQFQLRSREKGDWKREKISFRLTELNVADMRQVPIPMFPLSEQKRIAAYLKELQEKVESTERLQSEIAGELNALMPSILSKAFRGEL
jgi:type I restriction enzyme S subunit